MKKEVILESCKVKTCKHHSMSDECDEKPIELDEEGKCLNYEERRMDVPVVPPVGIKTKKTTRY